MRGGNSAGTQDDFVSFDGKLVSTALHLHGDGLGAVEENAVHHAVGPDGQIQPMSGLVQVAQRGAPANAVGVVAGYWTDAGGIRMVMVRTLWKSCRPARVVEGPLVRQPLVSWKASDNDRTLRAMEVVVAEVGVRLDLAEVLETMLKVPLLVALRSPLVIIFWHAAQEDLAI